MRAEGFSRGLGQWTLPLGAGEVQGREIILPGRTCVMMGAASSSATPLTMSVTAARGGQPLGRPSNGQATGFRILCAQSMTRVRASVGARGGATDAVLVARARPGVRYWDQSNDSQDVLDAMGDAMAEGWRLMEVPERLRIAAGEVLRRSWPTGRGCYRAVWVGRDAARGSLRWDQSGEHGAADVGGIARVSRCAAGVAEVSVRSADGAATEGWLMWLEPRGEPIPRR